MNLFVYGSLMKPDVLSRFVSGKPKLLSATLRGFAKGDLRSIPYPAIVSRANSRVLGKLVVSVPNSAWALLDEYEGALYRRISVAVITEQGRRVPAQVYELRPRFRSRWVAGAKHEKRPNPLLHEVLNILQRHPQGLREYELLEQLAEHPVLKSVQASAQLSLFQKHFLLMNALYQLRQKLENSDQYLEISPINIQLISKIPLTGSDSNDLNVNVENNLADYYLNWHNFDNTGAQEVQDLLDGFWQRYFKIDAREEALRMLNLDMQASVTEIQQRYRQLASQHHPDKGGSSEVFVKIREAYEMLTN